jgi:hypothetical protein
LSTTTRPRIIELDGRVHNAPPADDHACRIHTQFADGRTTRRLRTRSCRGAGFGPGAAYSRFRSPPGSGRRRDVAVHIGDLSDSSAMRFVADLRRRGLPADVTVAWGREVNAQRAGAPPLPAQDADPENRRGDVTSSLESRTFPPRATPRPRTREDDHQWFSLVRSGFHSGNVVRVAVLHPKSAQRAAWGLASDMSDLFTVIAHTVGANRCARSGGRTRSRRCPDRRTAVALRDRRDRRRVGGTTAPDPAGSGRGHPGRARKRDLGLTSAARLLC